MNIIDLKRKALGWMARLEGDSDSGAAGASARGQSDSQAGENSANNSGSFGGGRGWTGNRSERDARDAGNMSAGHDDGSPAGDDGFTRAITDKVEALQKANPDVSIDRDAMISALQTRAPVANDRDVSEAGWSYGEVSSLSKQGFGNLTGINANNMDGQTVDNVMASRVTHDRIMPAVAGLVTAAVPGAGLALSGVRAAGRVSSGQTTLGQEAKNFAIDYLGNKVAGAINSKIGSAIGPENMAGIGLIGSVSKAFGGPSAPNIGASVVSGALNVAGISKSTGTGFTSQNNPAADNGFTAPGTNYGGNGGNAFTGMDQPGISTPATPTAKDVLTDSMDTNVNMNLWGSIDGAGWRAAKSNYINSKGA